MEKAVGIVCEFNPFHSGHEYLIQRVKEAFPHKSIVCVMSGNFVQRGSFAVQEKYSRASCALHSGADLVLELPYPFSTLSAESFAAGAVTILQKTGLCDTLAFGTEIADAFSLTRCAENLSSEEFKSALKEYLEAHKGCGYPLAREAVYEKMYGKTPVLSSPNASLAVEYLRCNALWESPFALYPVLRKGEGIRSAETGDCFASATGCRALIAKRDWETLSQHVPAFSLEEMKGEEKAGRFPVSEETLSQILFYLLRTRSRDEFKSIYGFSPLCDRAMKAADGCSSLEALVERMKSSNFTDSRIRRGLLALLLNTPRFAEKESPLFTQVLAASGEGRALLATLREDGAFPVFTKPAHGLKHSDYGVRKQVSRAALADRIYLSAFPTPHEEGYFLKKMPRML